MYVCFTWGIGGYYSFIWKVSQLETLRKPHIGVFSQEETSPRKSKKKRRGKKGRRSTRRSSEEERPPTPPPPTPVPPAEDKPAEVQGVVLENGEEGGVGGPKEYFAPDADVLVVTSYEQALQTAHHFLFAFLRKCSGEFRIMHAARGCQLFLRLLIFDI